MVRQDESLASIHSLIDRIVGLEPEATTPRVKDPFPVLEAQPIPTEAPRDESLPRKSASVSAPERDSTRVFLCHSKGDKALVRGYYQRLCADGVNPWLDEEDLLPGQVWELEIRKAVRSSAAVVVFISGSSTSSSGFVHKEIKFALDVADAQPEGSIFVIPVRLENCDVAERLQHIHYVDLFQPGGYEKLLRTLRAQGIIGASVGEPGPPPVDPLWEAFAATRPSPTLKEGPHVRERLTPTVRLEEDSSAQPELLSSRDFQGKLSLEPETKGSTRRRWTIAVWLLGLLVAALGGWRYFGPLIGPPVQPAAGTVKTNPRDGSKYVYIPPGTFRMGCSDGDSECDDDEKPVHEVRITKGFWIGQTEVTQGAYAKVTGQRPSTFKGDDLLPVENVNWEESKQYCAAIGGRLPTVAEWEYAARGGSTSARHGSLDEIAWHNGNSGSKTHPVGQKKANGFGLYDILGNVWEWTADWFKYSYYKESPAEDPQGPSGGESRVLRGGSWVSNSGYARVSIRSSYHPSGRDRDVGFRCVGENSSLEPFFLLTLACKFMSVRQSRVPLGPCGIHAARRNVLAAVLIATSGVQ